MTTWTAMTSLLAGYLGGWEMVIILVVLVILLSAASFPDFFAGLRRGMDEFRKATDEVSRELRGEVSFDSIKANPHTDDGTTFDQWVLWVAQGFDVGRIPKAPGTFGTLVGLLWFAIVLVPGSFFCYLLGTLLGLAASVWFCGRAEKILGQSDPGSVVLDEIAALPLCFLPWLLWEMSRHGAMPSAEYFFSGGNLLRTAEAFLIFRIFDIWKPWPVRQSQRLPGGWGVTVDDVLAAVYTGLVVLALVAL